MDYNIRLLEERLADKLIGHKIYYYPEIGSTNDETYQLGLEAAPEGTVVIADTQTKGKGRQARVWHSPAGSNIYTSILLRPDIQPAAAPQISLVAGVAVAEIIEQYCPDKAELKWPNDILIKGKKVCGILSEMETVGNKVDFVVVGIGINVNMKQGEFSPDIRDSATALSLEVQKEVSRQDLIIALYENLAKWYKKLLQNGFGIVKKRWLSLSPMIGRKVRVVYFNKTITGKVLGIDEKGSLIILNDKGEELKVTAGDATILKE
jgi:BirA family transcriptional regulator, biotin operon repressor / biotin---[acetyl-CoA-carboxylase] ligase